MTKVFLWLYNKIAPIVREWDPEGLLKMGAPIDEYDAEIEMIAGSIYRCTDLGKTVDAVSEIFTTQMETAEYTVEFVKPIAEKVFEIFEDFNQRETLE